MKKRGFTLVEIIVAIGLLTVIGVGSFVGIRAINNKKILNKLNKITNKVLEAAQVYIETNKEARNQLYEEENGVVLPIQLLVNEGLLDIKSSNITEEEIKNEYVLLAESPSVSDEGSVECQDISESVSWSNKPVYLCLSNEINENIKNIQNNVNSIQNTVNEILFKVNGYISSQSTIENRNKLNIDITLNDIYYYKGSGTTPRNYLKYKNKTYRILSVDTDDSITIMSETEFDNTFKDKNMSMAHYTIKTDYLPEASYPHINSDNKCDGPHEVVLNGGCLYKNYGGYVNDYKSFTSENNMDFNLSNNYEFLDFIDLLKTSPNLSMTNMNYNACLYTKCENSWLCNYYIKQQTSKSCGRNCNSGICNFMPNAYKIHLKPCMKIISGTGGQENPYILEDKCS